VIHLLSPDKIVLGGGLVEAMPDLFLRTVRESTADRTMPAYAETYEILATELEDDAGVLGCIAWARKMIEG
jgi:glucokinase